MKAILQFLKGRKSTGEKEEEPGSPDEVRERLGHVEKSMTPAVLKITIIGLAVALIVGVIQMVASVFSSGINFGDVFWFFSFPMGLALAGLLRTYFAPLVIDRKKPDGKMESRFVGYRITRFTGIVLMTAIILFLTGFLHGWLIPLYAFFGILEWGPLGKIMSATIVFLVVGLPGMNRVPIAWNGSIMLLGGRVNKLYADEGFIPLPAFLMGIEGVNMKEATMVIKDIVARTSNRMEVICDITILYRVFDPYRFLSIGPSTVDTGLHDRAIAAQYAEIESYTDLQLIGKDKSKKISDAIRYRLDAETDLWGIWITGISLKNIRMVSKKTQEAYEAERQQSQQIKAEKRQREYHMESFKLYRDQGLSPNASAAMIAGSMGDDVKISVRSLELSEDLKDNPGLAHAATQADGWSEGVHKDDTDKGDE